MTEVHRALGRSAEARGWRRTPSCPALRSGGPCCPLLPGLTRASSLEPCTFTGALAAREVCLSAETGIFSGHPSQSVGEDSPAPAPQLPQRKPSAPSGICLASGTRPFPIWPEEAQSVAWAVLALRCGHGGSYLRTTCEVPKGCSHPAPAAASQGGSPEMDLEPGQGPGLGTVLILLNRAGGALSF